MPPEPTPSPKAHTLSSRVRRVLFGPEGQRARRDAPDLFGALKPVGEAGAVLSALTFVAGWSYMASYYMMFGLNPLELDFSLSATSAFSIHMLRHSGWTLLLTAGLAYALLVRFGRSIFGTDALSAAAYVALLFVTVAFTSSWRGRALAREDMWDTSARLPNVGFVSKSPSLQPDCLGQGTTDCKLLLYAKGTYYFFEPISLADPSSQRFRNLNVYMTHNSEIIAVHLQRGID